MRTTQTPPARSEAGLGSTPSAPRGRQQQAPDVGLGADARSPRVLIADDHPTSRHGIRLALERAGFAVVADAATGEDAVDCAVATRPDACIVDLDIPGGGIAVVRAIRARVPGVAVLTLTAVTNEEDFVAAITAGASGYLLKTMNPERLAVALRAVLIDDLAVVPRALGNGLFDEIGRRRDTAQPIVREPRVCCRAQESQVVRLMRQDLSTRDIAARLNISDATVRRRVSAALRELGASDRRSAIDLLARAAR